MMGETVLLLVGAAVTGQLGVCYNTAVKSLKRAIHENFVQILNDPFMPLLNISLLVFSCNESKEKIEAFIATTQSSSAKPVQTTTSAKAKPTKSAKTTAKPSRPSTTRKINQQTSKSPSASNLDGPRIDPLDPPELLGPSKLQSKSSGAMLNSFLLPLFASIIVIL